MKDKLFFLEFVQYIGFCVHHHGTRNAKEAQPQYELLDAIGHLIRRRAEEELLPIRYSEAVMNKSALSECLNFECYSEETKQNIRSLSDLALVEVCAVALEMILESKSFEDAVTEVRGKSFAWSNMIPSDLATPISVQVAGATQRGGKECNLNTPHTNQR